MDQNIKQNSEFARTIREAALDFGSVRNVSDISSDGFVRFIITYDSEMEARSAVAGLKGLLFGTKAVIVERKNIP